ncbi:hypothetical protein GCM10027614_51630 [Micromonospora vulcania]
MPSSRWAGQGALVRYGRKPTDGRALVTEFDESTPPYLRIVGELRRRITAGELGPGDRVPSTRQIVREWGSRWRPPAGPSPHYDRRIWSGRCPAWAWW